MAFFLGNKKKGWLSLLNFSLSCSPKMDFWGNRLQAVGIKACYAIFYHKVINVPNTV